jgi:hypothetical protein
MYEFDRIGQSFGSLKVVDKSEFSNSDASFWICLCKCGNARVVDESRLIQRMITMCVKCEVKRNWMN